MNTSVKMILPNNSAKQRFATIYRCILFLRRNEKRKEIFRRT